MGKNKLFKFFITFLALTLFISTPFSFGKSYANEVKQSNVVSIKNVQENDVYNNVSLDGEVVVSSDLKIEKKGNGVKLDNVYLKNQTSDTIKKFNDTNTVQPLSLYEVDGLILNTTDSLTVADSTDLFFFSPTSNKTLLTQFSSVNSDYELELCIVDWDNMLLYNTGIVREEDQLLLLTDLPAGDYALEMRSKGSLGDNYNLKMNASNPSNFTEVLTLTNTYNQFVAKYADGSIYANGKYVLNMNGSNTHLDWERNYYFPSGGGYRQRKHSISNVNIKSISRPISYSSSYASSNNAIMIYLNTGTSFMYHESQYQSGTNPYYHSSFVDILGKTTPRQIDADDFNYGDHILIFNLNTGQPIDFYSVLNFYYGAGIEALPTVSFLN